ncbi:MAG: ATP-binding protein [Gallionella sp.]|jgi:two-component system sensor histidine kinase QseC
MSGLGSLKQRLLLLAMTTVVMVWIGATAFTYFDASEEFDEILDAHLAQSASLLAVQASQDQDELETEHAPLLHKYSRRVAFQVWEEGHKLRLHSANAPMQPLADREPGFSNSLIDGKRWRVFSTWDGAGMNLIHVAELSEVRDDLAAGIIGNLLKPLLISLPLLAVLLWIAVARGLQPLVRLTAEVEQREPDNLAPLDAGAAPAEVLPLIERLNRLFVRMEVSLQKERRFTADAAHELRTPVAGIKAQAQVARAASSDAERMHALDNAILGCDRAAHLIEQLLTLARIDNLGDDLTEGCPLRRIAAEVIAEIAPNALKQNVRLELTDGDEMSVQGNPLLLRVLLRNLIDNAVHHTSAGTRVQIGVTQQLGQTYLSVSDNGPGIPEAELAKVLERFYRPVGSSASGSGLGLSIVSRIAEIHHAELKIVPGQEGLCVTVGFKS